MSTITRRLSPRQALGQVISRFPHAGLHIRVHSTEGVREIAQHTQNSLIVGHCWPAALEPCIGIECLVRVTGKEKEDGIVSPSPPLVSAFALKLCPHLRN